MQGEKKQPQVIWRDALRLEGHSSTINAKGVKVRRGERSSGGPSRERTSKREKG